MYYSNFLIIKTIQSSLVLLHKVLALAGPISILEQADPLCFLLLYGMGFSFFQITAQCQSVDPLTGRQMLGIRREHRQTFYLMINHF